MDGIEVVLTVFFVGLFFVQLVHQAYIWHLQRKLLRSLAGLKAGTPSNRLKRPTLVPESLYVVHLTGDEVRCEAPDGTSSSVRWSDLNEVRVDTTSDGPALPDVFWVLRAGETECIVPQGATGDSPLLERMQQLRGFDNRAFTEAMCCASDRSFVCWTRPMTEGDALR